MYCQVFVSNINKPYMVIPTRYNQETFIYPNPDVLPSNSISDETIETINKILQNSEVITIQRLKNGDIVITFKEKVIKYKKGND